MELKHGRLATALEGQHDYKVGSVITFMGMDYEAYEEETLIFKNEHGVIMYLVDGEFKWVGESE